MSEKAERLAQATRMLREFGMGPGVPAYELLAEYAVESGARPEEIERIPVAGVVASGPDKPTGCKGCGRKIFYAESSMTGANVPLDARAVGGHVYSLGGDGKAWPQGANGAKFYVSHYLTCPAAAMFGRGRSS